MRLLPYKLILIAYDVDQTGDEGAAAWLFRSRRVIVPVGDDLTSFCKASDAFSSVSSETLFCAAF